MITKFNLMVCYILLNYNKQLFGAKQRTSVFIGIFFGDEKYDDVTRTAIKNALSVIKARTKFSVEHEDIVLHSESIFEDSQQVCDLVASRPIAAMFVKGSPEISDIIQSVSSTLQIPHFQTFWDPKAAELKAQQISSTVFNLHPSLSTLSQAIATLVLDNDWKSFTIIYENEEALLRLQEFLKLKKPYEFSLTFRKLGPGPDYRAVLKQIKNSKDSRFILDCKFERILDVLRQAREVKLLEDYHSYILTDLDAYSLNWAEFKNVKTNFTIIRLVDTESEVAKNVGKLWKIDTNHIKTQTALMYDALNLFMTAFNSVAAKEEPSINVLDCLGNSVSEIGEKMKSIIKKPPKNQKTILPGYLTGQMSFDDHGERQKVNLQILEMIKSEADFRATGIWNSDRPNEILYLVSSEEREREFKKEFQQQNFKVVSRLGPPYLMQKIPEYGKVLYGNDQYEGYAMDLMHEICKIHGCNYTFELVPDNKYGNFDPVKNEWNGLIRHLLDRKADLAVCDLTITYERSLAVSFTMPFMTLGISILYAKPVKEPPDLLKFSHPFSLDVWLYMATSYLIVSIIIFLVARLNPNDWENPHPCDSNPEELENIWTIRNCCWLTLGSIVTQGCDLLPKGISTRMATASWWFFSLIMTSSYTANMAAFLTMSRLELNIESAEDLATQSKIKYGCLSGGSTCAFFRDTNFSTYHNMWVQMESADPTVFESSNEKGVKRVQESKRKYAFLMENTNIEYETERNCDLFQVGGQIDSKGYGIAMNPKFQYRKSFNEAILKMQEMGVLNSLKRKWWIEKNGGGVCQSTVSSGDEAAEELDLDNVGGVFVVLGVGVITALIFAVCEFLWMVKKVAVREHALFKEAVKQELRFAFNIWARQKKVKRDSPASILD